MKFFNPSLCVLAAVVAFMAAAMNPPSQLYLTIGIILLAIVLLTTRRVLPVGAEMQANNDSSRNRPGTDPFN
jgi:hypothetical protein